MIGFPLFNKSARNINLSCHALVESAPTITVLCNVGWAAGFGVNVRDMAFRLGDDCLLLQREDHRAGVDPVGLNSTLPARNNELSKG